MIDPLSAFAALKTASTAISTAVKAGKDLKNLVGPITKLAKAEADLSFAAEKKGGLFGKLTGAEQTAIDAHFRKEEAKRLRDELRSLFMLYGSAGQWERLQAEIANERARRRELLKQQEQERYERQIFFVIITGVIITSGIIIMLLKLKGVI
tara:strand:- start:649 stop:1104 length:456 start_codon:yes stop_codon:yes gene_type:complete